jgi:site-specific DNA recombinase
VRADPDNGRTNATRFSSFRPKNREPFQRVPDSALWARVDERLRHNGITGGKEVRNKYGALLRGLLHCDACGTAMVHTYTTKGSRRYSYYVCLKAQQQGWDSCPSKSIPAQRVEESIVDRIRSLGQDSRIAAETARKVQEQVEGASQELRAELKTAEKEMGRLGRELAKVAASPGSSGTRTDRMADLQERIQATERRAAEIRDELTVLEAEAVPQWEIKQALQAFGPVWKWLHAAEQTRIVRALIKRVGYDGRTGRVAVTFRSAGFKSLCETVEANADK